MALNLKKRIEQLELRNPKNMGFNELIVLKKGETKADYYRKNPDVIYNPLIPSLIITIASKPV